MGDSRQLDLLSGHDATRESTLPEGVKYSDGLLTAAEEQQAATAVSSVDLKPFAFRGFVGNRRTASFGWHYDFQEGGLQTAGQLPAALIPYRKIAAGFAGVEAESLEHCPAFEVRAGCWNWMAS